ncbi:MAG: hypothetical protein IKT68_04550 [Clostridia bacterium]|nr:hypothetical protein [Clostridia bacterium]
MHLNEIIAYLQKNKKRKPAVPTGITKNYYLDVIEKAVNCYSDERLQQWLAETQKNGIQEHGFLRVVALLGVMIAKGRMLHRKELFLQMMTFCCDTMANGKGGNDFGVKEILYTLREVKDIVPGQLYARWINGMKRLDPLKNYTCLAKDEIHCPGNWAVFNMAGEAVRANMGLCNSTEYFNQQIPSQLTRFDQNGCYRDPHEPMLYDAITRNQFSVMLFEGYDGTYAQQIDQLLKQGELFSLMTQSAHFEFPFGGRSNQMVFNEFVLATCFEYAARRYKNQGDVNLAGMFKRAARLAALATDRFMTQSPAKHVKNSFPWNSIFGGEGYGYYDKYMITVGSNAYMAYLFADDEIEERVCPAEIGGYTLSSSEYFHKFFAAAGGYSLEFDTKGDQQYESTGLGQIHKVGLPGELLSSLPFSPAPGFCITDDCFTSYEELQLNWDNIPKLTNPSAFSLCSAVVSPDGQRVRICDIPADQLTPRVTVETENPDQVVFVIEYRSDLLPCPIYERYTLCEDGVTIAVSANLPTGYSLLYLFPQIMTDGKERGKVTQSEQTLSLSYRGHQVVTEHNGTARDTELDYRNRNGIYRGYEITAAQQPLILHIQLL